MILAGDEATPAQQVLHRLIDTTVAIGQLVGIRAGRQGQDLVAQADSENRFAKTAQQPTHLGNERCEVLGIAGPVANQDAVGCRGQAGQVGVPRRAQHAGTTDAQRAHDIVLGADVDQQHGAFALAIAHRCARRHLAKDFIAHFHRCGVVARVGLAGRRHAKPPLHRSMLAQLAGEQAGVDAGQTRNTLCQQPVMQRTAGCVMAVGVDIVLDHEALHLDVPRFVGSVQASRRARRWHAVAADERISQYKDLATVGRVGERFYISGHAGIEDNLASHQLGRAETTAQCLRAVIELQSHGRRSRHTRRPGAGRSRIRSVHLKSAH